MSIYLFAVQEKQRFSIKQIHKYACDYLCDWFPKLGSYSDFSNRLNQLSEAFRRFASSLFEDYLPSDCFTDQILLDSMPIITCSGKRNAKVAKELVK